MLRVPLAEREHDLAVVVSRGHDDVFGRDRLSLAFLGLGDLDGRSYLGRLSLLLVDLTHGVPARPLDEEHDGHPEDVEEESSSSHDHGDVGVERNLVGHLLQVTHRLREVDEGVDQLLKQLQESSHVAPWGPVGLSESAVPAASLGPDNVAAGKRPEQITIAQNSQKVNLSALF